MMMLLWDVATAGAAVAGASRGATALWVSLSALSCRLMKETDIADGWQHEGRRRRRPEEVATARRCTVHNPLISL